MCLRSYPQIIELVGVLLIDFLFYILAGAGVGLAVGLTGVGGGSLMTPLLILWGIPEKIAIGTDLLYAAITKAGGAWTHAKQRSVRWDVVALLAAGSIPASMLTSLALSYLVNDNLDYSPLLNKALGAMLVLTGIVLLFKKQVEAESHDLSHGERWYQRHNKPITVIAGFALGILVTLSSVGAGAFCAVLLLSLYPRLSAIGVVGTDIDHAVPLTFIAGMGHFVLLGNIDFALLGGLLVGSLPAVHVGAKLANRVPNGILRPILATLLVIIGVKFAFF